MNFIWVEFRIFFSEITEPLILANAFLFIMAGFDSKWKYQGNRTLLLENGNDDFSRIIPYRRNPQYNNNFSESEFYIFSCRNPANYAMLGPESEYIRTE